MRRIGALMLLLFSATTSFAHYNMLIPDKAWANKGDKVDPAAYASRKELSQAVWQIVAEGAATLRQNRPVRPALHPAPDGDSPPAQPAFA